MQIMQSLRCPNVRAMRQTRRAQVSLPRLHHHRPLHADVAVSASGVETHLAQLGRTFEQGHGRQI